MGDRISSTSAAPFGGAAGPGRPSARPSRQGSPRTAVPGSAPWSRRETIVRRWLGRRDEPGTWTFASEVLATEEDLGIVRGETTYLATAEEPEARYANLWLIRFAPDGRARRFEEWWVLRSDVADAGASGGEGDR